MKVKHQIAIGLFELFIMVSANSQAQNFAPVGATWYFTYNLAQIPPPALGITFTKFESTKDTVVNGWDCKIIHLSRAYDCSGYIVNTSRFYILYSINSKVYEIENNHQYLLYDFNKNAGEYWILPKYNNDTVFVDAVSTVTLTNGQTRKVQYVHIVNTTIVYEWIFSGSIIENIGYDQFVFPYLPMIPCPEGGQRRCYSENDIMVNIEFLPCDYQTVDIENKNVKPDIILLQNPIDDKLEIQIADISLLPLNSITIYNNIGEVIYQQNSIANNSIVIDLSEKKNGFYYVTLLLKNNQLVIKKIIKL